MAQSFCIRCVKSTDDEYLLPCDNCGLRFHSFCVGMTKIRIGKWYCPQCRYGRLPWGREEVKKISAEELFRFFDSYEPIRLSALAFNAEVAVFIDMIYSQPTALRPRLAEHLFRLVAKNEWFMTQNPRFKAVILKKLEEFKSHKKPEISRLAQQFKSLRRSRSAPLSISEFPVVQTD